MNVKTRMVFTYKSRQLAEIAYNATDKKSIDEMKQIAKGALECSMSV